MKVYRVDRASAGEAVKDLKDNYEGGGSLAVERNVNDKDLTPISLCHPLLIVYTHGVYRQPFDTLICA
jgi:hypothetical protein